MSDVRTSAPAVRPVRTNFEVVQTGFVGDMKKKLQDAKKKGEEMYKKGRDMYREFNESKEKDKKDEK